MVDTTVSDAVNPTPVRQPLVKYQLAYEAAFTCLKQQDGTLANLRIRATSVFSMATLVAALMSAAGLVTKSPTYPIGIDAGLLAAIALIGFCTLRTVWPIKAWHWGPSVPDLLRSAEDEDEVRKAATRTMNESCGVNNSHLKRRMKLFQASIILLGLETALVVSAVIAYR